MIICMFTTLAFWSFSVCRIYRSPWIRICLRLVAVWTGFGHFPYSEVSMRWLSFINLFGPLLSPHFLSTSLLHISRHVSLLFFNYIIQNYCSFNMITFFIVNWQIENLSRKNPLRLYTHMIVILLDRRITLTLYKIEIETIWVVWQNCFKFCLDNESEDPAEDRRTERICGRYRRRCSKDPRQSHKNNEPNAASFASVQSANMCEFEFHHSRPQN